MSVVNFSMQDIQTAWENGGQDAYFANDNAYGGAGGSTPAPKANTQVLVRGKKGSFFRTQMTNAGNAAKGAARGSRGLLVGTADNAGRAVKAAGSGVATAGMYASDRAHELGSVIRRNPRTAGAVILGGTALGVGGGAMAMRRKE